jgi:hydrogenase expression/formation protein HypD
VTPVELVDAAIEIASRPGVVFASFGDMLRVPGSREDLLAAKARGADVRMTYSPLDALAIARANPGREVVFFAVGFETTAPANAHAVRLARAEGIANFSILVSHVLVPPAMEAILASPERRVQGFLGAGHVCAVMGTEEYAPIAERFRVPIVVTGFEPLDLLEGILLCVRQLEAGRHEVENQYARSVRREGNAAARAAIDEVFEVAPRRWRGIGDIPRSGLRLRRGFEAFDALRRFGIDPDGPEDAARDAGECVSGLVLQGIVKPSDCPAFGTRCTPERPLGATMVSSEGACAAYYRYRGAGAAR